MVETQNIFSMQTVQQNVKSRQHKKLFLYPAGLISLMLLPILCIWYLLGFQEFEKTTALELNWPNEEWSNRVFKEYGFKIHPDREFAEILITGDDVSDKIKLDSSQNLVRLLTVKNDTIKGIHFHFEDQANYWTFIYALDILNFEKSKSYVAYDNDIWVYNLAPRKVKEVDTTEYFTMECGTGWANVLADRANKKRQRNKRMLCFCRKAIKVFAYPDCFSH